MLRKKFFQLDIKFEENFGVIMPTYWEGLPSIILDYLNEAKFNFHGENHYKYFIATYGCDYGNILSTAQKEFGKIGIKFDSLYAARFVDNWSPMFYLKDAEKNRRAEINGEIETAEIAKKILNREVGHSLPDQISAISAFLAKENYNRIRKTKLFNVNKNKCIRDNVRSTR